ncbi:mechanosensitive ion channel family protein [Marivirga sp.]|uniref:mechanosensitive ion channel family protein n=1 Tax=Marivirga sp. TaxID=2018662 RepID=UPI002D80DF1E|nr:mechanosensitive ion channel domain-containing protein [Marivirga sp.]HET8861130.1 mechanosensitive ion channel domain-containing protein [Marivirga sp.]
MNKKSIAPTVNLERKKRIWFIVKAVTFIAALVAINNFKAQLLEIGIPPHYIKALRLYLNADLWISFIRLAVVFYYQQKHKLSRGVKSNFILGINHIANIIHTFVLIGAILLLFTIDPINLITSLSIVAAAIAILSKDYIANMINGMLIMFSEEVMIGDEIKIGDVKGTVTDITLVNMHIVNDDEDLIYIPNSLVFTTQIFNYTKRAIRKVSFDFDLKNEFATDVASIEKHIIDVLHEYHQYIKDDSYVLRIIKINENFTSLKFQFVLHRHSSVREKDTRKAALRQVLKYIGDAIHQKSEVKG